MRYFYALIIIASLSSAMTGCISMSQSDMPAQGNQPPLIINVAQDKQPFYQAINNLNLPPKTPQPAPQGTPNGPYKGITEKGEDYTTFVKNGYFDESIVIYYPNFVTQLRADLVNGLYEGWVTYQLPTAIIKQKALFHQGIIQEAMVYDESGKLAYHFWFTNEQPTSGIRYDSNGLAVESMF